MGENVIPSDERTTLRDLVRQVAHYEHHPERFDRWTEIARQEIDRRYA
jgi:hypothetical protein